MSLRTEAQWIIHQQEPVSAIVRVLETIALAITGRNLAHHKDIEIRGMANLMIRQADVRFAALAGQVRGVDASDEEREAIRMGFEILSYLATGVMTPERQKALDEFYAAAFHLDSRLTEIGVGGGSWEARLSRGE